MTRTLPLLLCILISLTTSCREETPEQRADALHGRIFTLDSHTDTPGLFTLPEYNIMNFNPGVCVDLPKMELGGLDAAFFAAFIRQGPRDEAGFAAAREKALSMIGDIYTIAEKHSDHFTVATTPEEGYAAKRAGQRAMYIGIENGYPVGRNLDLINEYYDLGVRYITLCHTRNNDICDSANDPAGPEHGGLSDFGGKVIDRMNELGMLVDISHVSEQSAFDAIARSRVPVVASHSCAKAVCDNPRNMSDSLLVALADRGGVMQLCILSIYVRPTLPNVELDSALRASREHFAALAPLSVEQQIEQRADVIRIYETYPFDLPTVAEAVDHIDHVVALVGVDHVGIGTDFDGGGQLADCRNAAQLKNITAELIRRGYSDADIEKIWSGNFMRVMQAAQDYAAR